MNDQKQHENRPVVQLPRWSVILHNDDVNGVEYVQDKVQEIARLTNEEAIGKVVEAQEVGHSVLMTTHHERAELIEERFKMAKITVTLRKL